MLSYLRGRRGHGKKGWVWVKSMVTPHTLLYKYLGPQIWKRGVALPLLQITLRLLISVFNSDRSSLPSLPAYR